MKKNKKNLFLSVSAKKAIRQMILLLTLLLLPRTVCCQAQEDTGKAKWTVMIYLCGSDIESRHKMATFNLQEIAGCPAVLQAREEVTLGNTADIGFDQVQVVIQTGGCKKWYAKETLGMDISSEQLQRYVFDPAAPAYAEGQPFILQQEIASASMGAPETLSDFIRWSVDQYPADKYALVLWDHGGGSRSGIFIDELFDQDTLYLDELDQALNAAGTHLEAVAIDACLMGSLETASVLAPYAGYMIASEEVAAGYGSAFGEWLSELYVNPDCTGREFGRFFCDATQHKYSKIGETASASILTFSVTDLSAIGEVKSCFDRFALSLGEIYETDSFRMYQLCQMINRTEKFGMSDEPMLDLGSVFHQPEAPYLLGSSLRNDMVAALSQAVCYSVRGQSRSSSTGLSFCWATALTPQELDQYARNFPMPSYLAFLEAITPDWTAPESIYEHTPRLEKIDFDSNYTISFIPGNDQGLPVLRLPEEIMNGFGGAFYDLYQLNEATGNIVHIRRDPCEIFKDADGISMLAPDHPEKVAAIDGVLCNMNFISENQNEYLYSVPIQLGNETYDLRCSYHVGSSNWYASADSVPEESIVLPEDTEPEATTPAGTYQVYGLWEGFDDDSQLSNRNVTSLAQVQGQEYNFLYPIHTENQEDMTYYDYSPPMTMYRNLDMETISLPPGTYYLRYVVINIFGREKILPIAQLSWDGSTFSLVGDSVYSFE